MKNYTNPLTKLNDENRYQKFVGIVNQAIGICATPEQLLLLRQFVDCVDFDNKEVKNIIYNAQMSLSLNHEQLVEDVLTITCNVFELTRANLLSKSRKREFVDARRCAMAIIHYFSRKTLDQISLIFDKDHASVINMVKTFNMLMDSDPKFKNLCEQVIEQMWESGYIYGGRLDKIQAKIKTKKKNNGTKRVNTEARIARRTDSKTGKEPGREDPQSTLQTAYA